MRGSGALGEDITEDKEKLQDISSGDFKERLWNPYRGGQGPGGTHTADEGAWGTIVTVRAGAIKKDEDVNTVGCGIKIARRGKLLANLYITMMRYFDAFSGYGGFSLGIQKAYANAHRGQIGGIEEDSPGNEEKGERLVATSWEGTSPKDRRLVPIFANLPDERPLCVGFSEIDKYAIETYQKHFPTHKNYGDITKIDETTLPDFDLLVGGFPCQSFSIAGRRRGFEDTRGTLFFDIARIVRKKQPRILLLENVKGLLSHDQGRTFGIIISTLDELGYDVQWQVLNSKNFGVPQNRERVFIVGHLRGTRRPEVFPIRENNGGHLQEITQGVSDAQRVYDPAGLAKSQKALGGGMGAKTGLYTIHQRSRGNNPGGEKELCPTLTGQSFQDNNHLVSGTRVRRLTPTECERLMGLPDGWTKIEMEQTSKVKKLLGIKKYLSDSQRYKLCGNGVVVNVVEEIMKRLL